MVKLLLIDDEGRGSRGRGMSAPEFGSGKQAVEIRWWLAGWLER